MNLIKHIPAGITQKVGRAVLETQKNSPTLLFGAGVVGVLTATVLACRATLKVEEILEGAKDNLHTANELHKTGHLNYSDEDLMKDVVTIRVRTVAKLVQVYGPALVVGAIGIGCLAGGQIVLNRRNVALTAAYAALEKGFNDYRARVADAFGTEKEAELRYAAEDREFIDETTSTVFTESRVGPNGASVYARYFDECSSSWTRQPEYNLAFLTCQQNWANEKLRVRGHLFLNEVYDALGIERSSAGAVVGWVISKDGDNFVDFGFSDGSKQRVRDFVNGREGSILLDFNVDGVVYDKI